MISMHYARKPIAPDYQAIDHPYTQQLPDLNELLRDRSILTAGLQYSTGVIVPDDNA